MARKKAKQLRFDLTYRGRGGYREGAGRPKKAGAGVPHGRRPELAARYPVHVTARVRDEAARLRSRALCRVVLGAISAGREREGFRRYVLGNAHVHAARRGRPVREDAIDPLSSAANRQLVAEPHTWLLRIGWTLGLPSG